MAVGATSLAKGRASASETQFRRRRAGPSPTRGSIPTTRCSRGWDTQARYTVARRYTLAIAKRAAPSKHGRALSWQIPVLGPIDYLAVEWPGRHVTGEGFRLLMDLVDREIVRVLDLLFIAKDADGTVSKVEVDDVQHSDALDERLRGLSSGLLDQSDIDRG